MKELLITVLFAAALPALAAEKDFKKESIAIPAADLKWEQPFGPQGPFVATVGDCKKGPCTIFFKLPAGYDSGWHTHDGWYIGTVIKGTATSQGQGDAAPVTLPVGSYFSEPGKKNHRNTCGADSECIILNFAEKGMTYNPKTADGKAPPKEPAAPAKKEEPKK
jgi:hypothetical protein